ncbi:uncharacterized protein LOC114279094 isoform X1 [Camellia sinensis]|uniref:uncharacterized protein LOC114279094 isoform X1 n=1 Tax=Camellia sinensis TaxID=4442 RepID=UPI001036681D|nr:uncharacterized protein LOC114279094 isoform X1 [Camellia sinensis]
MDSSFLEDPHPISPHLRPTSHATASATTAAAAASSQEETVSSELPKPEHTDYAAMMSVIYSMVKLDYIMQQRIVSSLNLKSSSGELESYSLMWSLRPFINNDIMHQAWRLIP